MIQSGESRVTQQRCRPDSGTVEQFRILWVARRCSYGRTCAALLVVLRRFGSLKQRDLQPVGVLEAHIVIAPWCLHWRMNQCGAVGQ